MRWPNGMPIDTTLPGFLRDYWRTSHKTHLGLLLDYDGTLTPIVDDPAQAVISVARQTLLVMLAQHPAIRVAVVSGRSTAQLLAFLPQLSQQPVVFCGLHGGHITTPAQPGGVRETALHVDSESHVIQTFKWQLLESLADHDLESGILLEDKTMSLAFHYKNMPQHLKQKAIMAFMQLYQTEQNGLWQHYRVQDGKDVLELLPVACNKGAASRWVLDYWDKQGISQPLACYAGDDLTDEAAFTEINQRHGLSIAVGKTPDQTQARCCVSNVTRVYEELALLLR
jgi:trehalose-phosphatase